MSESWEANALRKQLARWTAAGLIDAEQAGRIEAAEAEAATADAASHGKRPLVVEALGYMGAVIAFAAIVFAVFQYRENIPPGAQLALAAAAAAGLLTAGAVLRVGAEPALGRLRGVLWLLATISVTAFTAILVNDVLDLPGRDAAVLTAASLLACATPLWWRHRSVPQHVALFGGVLALIGTGMARIDPGVSDWAVGLAFWAASALWGVAAYRGYLAPLVAGLSVACVGLLTGALMTMDLAAGQALAVATAVGLLSAGVALHRIVLLGFGAAGAVIVVPQTADRYLPGTVAATLAAVAVGLALLGVALWLGKTHRRA